MGNDSPKPAFSAELFCVPFAVYLRDNEAIPALLLEKSLPEERRGRTKKERADVAKDRETW